MPTISINEPVHRLFATNEFTAFKAEPYNNERIRALAVILKKFCDGPCNISLIRQSASRMFSPEEVPIQRIFLYEIDRIEHPKRSIVQT